MITLQKVIPLKMLQMQGAEISSKFEVQRAIEINTFQLSASGFQLLCNAADGVFSAESSINFEQFLNRIGPDFRD
jgi:hypothetical protein